jgi:hypothetical protein
MCFGVKNGTCMKPHPIAEEVDCKYSASRCHGVKNGTCTKKHVIEDKIKKTFSFSSKFLVKHMPMVDLEH